MTNRTFPVAGTNLVIPWEIGCRAWGRYCHSFPNDLHAVPPKGLQDFQSIGFTEAELDEWAPDWREHAEERT